MGAMCRRRLFLPDSRVYALQLPWGVSRFTMMERLSWINRCCVMPTLTYEELLQLPQDADYSRRHCPGDLADYITRAIQGGDRRQLQPGDTIHAGIGVLTVTATSYTFSPANSMSEPTVLELARRFTSAVSSWLVAGAPVTTEAQYQSRARICEACPHWQPTARLGLGKC